MFSFHPTILLGCFCTCGLVSDSFFIEILIQGKFNSIICSNDFNFCIKLLFSKSHKILNA